jgi:hypothetical protein
VCVQVLQKRKSFPFGSAISAHPYNDHSQPKYQKYRDFIHQHFNWAVPENSLKWPSIEYSRVSTLQHFKTLRLQNFNGFQLQKNSFCAFLGMKKYNHHITVVVVVHRRLSRDFSRDVTYVWYLA